ncbi:MAG: hypothetical protein ACKO6A_07395 [Bacteroidota bacterium]
MKKALIFSATIAILSACNLAGDDDYKMVAKDLCDCTNKTSSGVSPKMKKAIIDVSKNGGSMEAAMQKMAEDDPTALMNDTEGLMKYASDFEKCSKDLEKKYDKLKTLDDDKEIQDKFLKAFEGASNCELTTAMMKIGLKESAKQKKP